MTQKIIDLAEYSDPHVGVLAGRSRGEAVRHKERLNKVDRDASIMVEVIIPDYIFSVNSSFSLGMFTPSVRLLGADGFRKKYTFRGPNAEKTRDETIRKALLTSNPLAADADSGQGGS